MVSSRFSFGRHVCEVEGDLLVFRYDGPMSEAEAMSLIEQVERLSFPPYGFFSISDLRKAGPSRPEIRKLFALYTLKHPSPASVCFGMQPLLRGVLTLTSSLFRAFKSKTAPLVVVNTEADARKWIDEQRQKLISIAS